MELSLLKVEYQCHVLSLQLKETCDARSIFRRVKQSDVDGLQVTDRLSEIKWITARRLITISAAYWLVMVLAVSSGLRWKENEMVCERVSVEYRLCDDHLNAMEVVLNKVTA